MVGIVGTVVAKGIDQLSVGKGMEAKAKERPVVARLDKVTRLLQLSSLQLYVDVSLLYSML